MRRDIVDSDSNIKIIKMMGSEHVRKIIQITSKNPLSASEISETGNIPLTKVYRWLQKLEECKLVQITGTINDEGRRIRFYKSLVHMIMIDPTKISSPKVEILGLGGIIKCSKCQSTNCTIVYDESNKTTVECLECKIKYIETISHSLNEEKQKFMILEGLSNMYNLREEEQKVFILEAIIDHNKNTSK